MPLADEDRPALRPPQFRLRTMLLLTAFCGGLLALTQWLSPLAVVGIAFLSLSVAAHVAGNAIGSRLREHAQRPQTLPTQVEPRQRHLPAERFAPATHLGKNRSLGWPLIVATATGAIVGGVAGGLWPFVTGPAPTDQWSVLVGLTAFATLGGIGSFLAAGFVQVAAGAIWQALGSGPSNR